MSARSVELDDQLHTGDCCLRVKVAYLCTYRSKGFPNVLPGGCIEFNLADVAVDIVGLMTCGTDTKLERLDIDQFCFASQIGCHRLTLALVWMNRRKNFITTLEYQMECRDAVPI